MGKPTKRILITTMALGAGLLALSATIPNLFPYLDSSGLVSTNATSGSFQTTGPFFQSLGTNGRTCATCHILSQGMGLSAAHAESVFEKTGGHDPLFAPVDGAVCPTAEPGKKLNFSLLRNYGLLRIALPVPANAQFSIRAVHDPYGCALVEDGGVETASMYRRPLPATNLGYLSAVMFDGREDVAPLNSQATFAANLLTDLKSQAADATTGHAQATAAPSDAVLTQIADFELQLSSAQAFDFRAGVLNAQGANGGARFLSTVPYYPGINDSLGNPDQFTPDAMTLYAHWADSPDPMRQSVARGEKIFNSQPLIITSVRGLNDSLNLPAINGTCTTCHDTPNVGDHSVAVPLEIGTSRTTRYETDPTVREAVAQLSMPDLPVFEIVCNAGVDAGQVTYTSDPGKALLSGQCSDVGRGKGLILRGLAARAPYFHNGSAATLEEVVDFYNVRFQMNLTPRDKTDLVNFLKTL